MIARSPGSMPSSKFHVPLAVPVPSPSPSLIRSVPIGSKPIQSLQLLQGTLGKNSDEFFRKKNNGIDWFKWDYG